MRLLAYSVGGEVHGIDQRREKQRHASTDAYHLPFPSFCRKAGWSNNQPECQCIDIIYGSDKLFYYRVEPYKHNNYMAIDNHT